MTEGNNLSDMLMNVKGDCPNCGTTLTFMESAQLAKDNDISEDAVMCHNCRKVYTVNITLHEMNFVEEITPKINENEKEDSEVNYAQIFKEAIEEENLQKAQDILDKWLTDYPDDANMFYATVIVRTLEGKSSTDSLNIILDSASKVKAKDTFLEDWYIEKANKSIEIQKELKGNESNHSENNKDNLESPQQNEIIRPNHQKNIEQKTNSDINPTQQIQQPIPQQPIPQQPIPQQPIPQQPIPQQPITQQPITNSNYNQPVSEERSIMQILFYKRDKNSQKFRISKTKTISILVFLFIFLFMLISMLMLPGYIDTAYIIGSILASIIAGLIVAVPVYLVGYFISYLLERDSGNNNQQNNPMPNQQNYQNTQNQQNYQMPNQPNNQNTQNQQNYQNMSIQQDIPQQASTIDFIPKPETTQAEPEVNNKLYYEKDNLGTRHDTFEKATAYWLGERFQMEEKYPFTLFTFTNAQDAENALLELPYIHKASDTGNLICDDVYIFGLYKVNEGNYEAIICGKDLSYNEFKQAEEAFSNHGGRRKNSLEPEKNNEKEVIETSNKTSSVKFREKINKDQYTYECYDADTKVDALEFLKQQEVSKGLYYICVYTPEGDFGRDIDGIYQM